MIEGHDIICFSNDWDGDPLSKKHIMLRLSLKNRILWVNSIGNRPPSASVRDLKRVFKKVKDFGKGCRQVADNIHTFTPLAVPFHGNAMARMLNRYFVAWSVRRACRRLGFKNPITWSFLPTSGQVVGSLNEKLIVYHCVDESKHVRVGRSYDEFVAHIDTCLAEGSGPHLSISDAMAGESWDAKVEAMSSLIQPLLSAKKSGAHIPHALRIKHAQSL
jgi:hypothetical protein